MTHKQADLDAVASSFGLKSLISEEVFPHKSDIVLVFPEGISKSAEDALKKCGINLEGKYVVDIEPELLRDSYALIVDTASSSQLPEWVSPFLSSNEKIFLIDHHYSNDLKAAVFNYYWEPGAASLSEIVASTLSHHLIDEELSKMLILGILADTGKFSRADYKTFEAMGILARKVSYKDVKRCLYGLKEDRSLRIARLKAMQRMIVEVLGEHILAFTFIGSFESDVADFLLKGGSDVALVISPKEEELRMVVKFREDLEENIKKKIAGSAERVLGVKGGGHEDMLIFVKKERLGKREAQKLLTELRDSIVSSME